MNPEHAAEAPDIVAIWERLGLPGIIDVHTHFLPPNIERRVWEKFDTAAVKVAREWPVRYRDDQDARVELLRRFGVRRFPSLPYAHKPGIAPYLNDWATGFAQRVPESIRSATFYPEPEAAAQVAALIADGVELFKIHVQVGEFHLDDPVLDEVWRVLEASRTPVLVHASGAPVPNEYTGASALGRVLAAHPDLVVILAHMGDPEFEDFMALVRSHPNLLLDTTIVFTDFTPTGRDFPEALLGELPGLQRRILFGTDFPIIPFPYVHQIESLERLGLGDDWLRDVLYFNAARLFDGES